MWTQTIGATSLVASSAFIGVLLLSTRVKKFSDQVLNGSISFASGLIISTTFVHLIPEINHLAHVDDKESGFSELHGIVFTSAILFSILVEHFAHQHNHNKEINSDEKDDSKSDPIDLEILDAETKEVREVKEISHTDPIAYNVIIGDAFHNFADGVLITSTFLSCPQIGWIVTASVLAHEIPHELLDFIILIRSGLQVKWALFWNFTSSLPAILAAVIITSHQEAINSLSLSYLITFGSGVLVFVAMTQLLPLYIRREHLNIFLIFLGMSTLIAIDIAIGHTDCN